MGSFHVISSETAAARMRLNRSAAVRVGSLHCRCCLPLSLPANPTQHMALCGRLECAVRELSPVCAALEAAVGGVLGASESLAARLQLRELKQAFVFNTLLAKKTRVRREACCENQRAESRRRPCYVPGCSRQCGSGQTQVPCFLSAPPWRWQLWCWEVTLLPAAQRVGVTCWQAPCGACQSTPPDHFCVPHLSTPAPPTLP